MYKRTERVGILPQGATPVDETTAKNDRLRVPTIPPRIRPIDPGQPRIDNFNMFCETLQQWEADLLQHVTLLSAGNSLRRKISEPILAASDGSVVDGKASYGWVVAGLDGTPWASGSGPAHGYQPSLYRAEAYGALSVL